MAAPVKVAAPELSGTFRTLPPEPTPARAGTLQNLPPEPTPLPGTLRHSAELSGTLRSLSGLKTPLAYALGEKETSSEENDDAKKLEKLI